MTDHIFVSATITDPHGSTDTVYAGSVPATDWDDLTYRAAWKRDRRKVVLADRTFDPHGWRVAFAAKHRPD